MANLTTFDSARDWMQGNRISDGEAKRREQEKRAGRSDGHAARTAQDISVEERLALLELTLPCEIFCNKTVSGSGKSPP